MIYDRWELDRAKTNTSGEIQKALSFTLWRCAVLIETFVSIQPLIFSEKTPKHQTKLFASQQKKFYKKGYLTYSSEKNSRCLPNHDEII